MFHSRLQVFESDWQGTEFKWNNIQWLISADPQKPNVTSIHYNEAELLLQSDKSLVKTYICSYKWWPFTFTVTWAERRGSYIFSLIQRSHVWLISRFILLFWVSARMFFHVLMSCSVSVPVTSSPAPEKFSSVQTTLFIPNGQFSCSFSRRQT